MSGSLFNDWNEDINIEVEKDGDNVFVKKWKSSDEPKPWIGITMQDGEEGVLLTRIHEDSPAEGADLRQGDVIASINGVSTIQAGDVVGVVGDMKPGESIEVVYVRDGETSTKTIELGERNQEPFVIARDMDIDLDFDLDHDFKFDFDFDFESMSPKTLEWTRSHEITIKGANKDPSISRNLELEGFNAFPNPTQGNLNISFNGEPGKPITVTIIDASGRQVYRTKVKQFDGSFNDQLEISNAVPGTMLITVTQGGRTYTENVIYAGRP